MSTPAIGACINEGVNWLKNNAVVAIVGLLIAGIISGITIGILGGAAGAGYIIAVRKFQKGEKPAIGDIIDGLKACLVPGIVAGLITGITMVIGNALLVIPGLLIMPIAFISIYLVAEGEKDGIAAIKRAINLYKGQLMPTLITFIVLGIVGAIGSIVVGIGGLITGPIAVAGMAHYTAALVGDAPAAAETPAAGAPAAEAPAAEATASDEKKEAEAPKQESAT